MARMYMVSIFIQYSMSIVNFSIPLSLEKRISEIIKKKGFGSKAEFFRFAAIYFIDVVDKPISEEEERFSYLSDALTREVLAKYQGKKAVSVRDQLRNL